MRHCNLLEGNLQMIFKKEILIIIRGLRYGGPSSFWKIWKRHFFQDIPNSFQWVTGVLLKPNQCFFKKKFPTNTVTRAIQNVGWNGLLLAGWLSNSKNFVVNLEEICDEQMLKISERYLDSSLSYAWITEKLLQQSASC